MQNKTDSKPVVKETKLVYIAGSCQALVDETNKTIAKWSDEGWDLAAFFGSNGPHIERDPGGMPRAAATITDGLYLFFSRSRVDMNALLPTLPRRERRRIERERARPA